MLKHNSHKTITRHGPLVAGHRSKVITGHRPPATGRDVDSLGLRQITLRPAKASGAAMARLQRLGIIRRLLPTEGLVSARGEKGRVERLHASAGAHGGPAVFGIAKRDVRDGFHVHPDPETIILVCPGAQRFDPLNIIFALRPARDIERRAAANDLTSADFLCLEMIFNDPRLSMFTVMPGYAHCETTRRAGGGHPIFFALEPARPVCRKLALNGYEVRCG